MTTNDFISKANALNGIYAVKHREGKRWLIEIFQRHHDDMSIDMSFAELFVERRILNFLCFHNQLRFPKKYHASC